MVQATRGKGSWRARIERGLIDVAVFDLRDFTTDRHRVVDDTPFGGGPGMVLKPEPFFRAMARIRETRGEPTAVMCCRRRRAGAFTHDAAAAEPRGAHRAVVRPVRRDRRARPRGARDRRDLDRRLRAVGRRAGGDGDRGRVVRLVPGVVGDERSVREDSSRGLLDHPHYTRPAEFEGRRVPDVLLSGHHGEIERWRRRRHCERTLERRPDLWTGPASLDAEQQRMLRELRAERQGAAGQRKGSRIMNAIEDRRKGAVGPAARNEVGRHREGAREGA